MKIIQFFIIAISIFLTNSGISQTWDVSWEKQFGKQEISYFSDIIIDTNGYAVLGSIIPANKNLQNFWLVRLNESGDTLWTKTYTEPLGLFPRRLVQSPDGGFLMTGSNRYDEKNYQLFLIKVDAAGKEEWRKNFGNELYCSGEDLVALDDGSFVIIGTKNLRENLENLWLFKIDQKGETIWEKIYGDENITCGESIKKHPDQGFIIAATTFKQGKKESATWILRTDEKGDTLWTSSIHIPKTTLWPECICCSPDSFLMVVGWRGTCLNDINSENPIFDFDISISKLDRYGKLQWTKNFDSEGSEGGNGVTIRPDGTFLIAGKKETSFSGNVGPWLLHINKDGKLISDNLIKFHFNNDQAAKIINTSDNGFVVIGPGFQSKTHDRMYGWIMKYNSK